jgi:hypothetical protein
VAFWSLTKKFCEAFKMHFKVHVFVASWSDAQWDEHFEASNLEDEDFSQIFTFFWPVKHLTKRSLIMLILSNYLLSEIEMFLFLLLRFVSIINHRCLRINDFLWKWESYFTQLTKFNWKFFALINLISQVLDLYYFVSEYDSKQFNKLEQEKWEMLRRFVHQTHNLMFRLILKKNALM